MSGRQQRFQASNWNKKPKNLVQIWKPLPMQAISPKDVTGEVVSVETDMDYHARGLQFSTTSINQELEMPEALTTGTSESINNFDSREESTIHDASARRNAETSTEKHSSSIQLGAPLIGFFRRKGASALKKIEKVLGVRILLSTTTEGGFIEIHDGSATHIDKAIEMIQALIDKAVKSSNLDYSHFISLPLASHSELVEKLMNFQNFILGTSDTSTQGNTECSSDEDAAAASDTELTYGDQTKDATAPTGTEPTCKDQTKDATAATDTEPSCKDQTKDATAATDTEPTCEDRTKDAAATTNTEPICKDRTKDAAATTDTEPTCKDRTKDAGATSDTEPAYKDQTKENSVDIEIKVVDDKQVKADISGIHLVSYQPKESKPPALTGSGIDKSIFIRPDTFHLTVLMLKLWNRDKVSLASEVLKSVSPKVNEALEKRPVTIRLKGLDCMRGSLEKARVLYANVEEVGSEGRLSQACQIIIDAFVNSGLVLEKDAKQDLKLHATLMNVRHRKGRRRKRPHFDAREIVKQFGSEEWGEYVIPEVHLSQRFTFDENGYYHCCASIPFPESCGTD